MKTASNSMVEGSIAGKLVSFAVPLFLGNLFQQLYNTADALIVGNYLGNEALAAVTSNSSLIYLLISFFMGISAGAGVVISRYFGAGDPEKMRQAVHSNLTLSLIFGAVLTVVGVGLTPQILKLMDTPDDVLPRSTAYLRTYFAGGIGLVLYNTCRGIMQAVGDSRHPLIYLIVSSMLNVVLDILFVGVFNWDVGGAAFATILSQLVSVVLCLVQLMRTKEAFRVSVRHLGLHPGITKMILSYGLPSGLQNSVIGLANVVVQSNINSFGADAMAGCGAYSKIEGFAFLPITSFNIAVTTFVGQNLGAKEYARAKRGARFGVWCSIIMAETVGTLMWLAAPTLVGLFTQDEAAIEFGVEKIRTCSLFFCLLAASHGLSAVLRGAGKATVPMVTMLVIWCVGRVLFIELMMPVFQSIAVVNWVYPLTWLLSTIVLLIYYFRADWVHNFERSNAQ